jgi:hypothetical protein
VKNIILIKVSQYNGIHPTGWMIGDSRPGRGWEFSSSPSRPDRLLGPPSLLSNRYQGLFSWGLSGRGVKLTTHLHPVPRLRTHGAILPLPQYAFISWCSVKKRKHGDNWVCKITPLFCFLKLRYEIHATISNFSFLTMNSLPSVIPTWQRVGF